jgi:hypothetical protein
MWLAASNTRRDRGPVYVWLKKDKSEMDNRQDFNDSWLCEMPEGLGVFDTYDQLVYVINDYINHGATPDNVKSNLWKIVVNQIILYWYQKNNQIILATELAKKPQSLVVSVTGKSPEFRGKPPYASDLYAEILDDNPQSLRLYSDKQLSDDGLKLWKTMMNKGYFVSVYDDKNPSASFKTLETPEEIDNFFKHDDTNYQRYQYVLSKKGISLSETRGYFHLRRYRELSGLLT